MAIYMIGERTTNTTIDQACAELRADTTGRNPRVLQLELIATAAGPGSVVLGRPAAIGLVPTTPRTPYDINPAVDPDALVRHAIAWGTSPTAPANPIRRWNWAAAGASIVWTFPGGLFIQPGFSLTIHNITVGVPLDVNWTIEE